MAYDIRDKEIFEKNLARLSELSNAIFSGEFDTDLDYANFQLIDLGIEINEFNVKVMADIKKALDRLWQPQKI
jgi:hypothetical protein